jgi:hypothetical protein
MGRLSSKQRDIPAQNPYPPWMDRQQSSEKLASTTWEILAGKSLEVGGFAEKWLFPTFRNCIVSHDQYFIDS